MWPYLWTFLNKQEEGHDLLDGRKRHWEGQSRSWGDGPAIGRRTALKGKSNKKEGNNDDFEWSDGGPPGLNQPNTCICSISVDQYCPSADL